jgi:hypothetical protein
MQQSKSLGHGDNTFVSLTDVSRNLFSEINFLLV